MAANIRDESSAGGVDGEKEGGIPSADGKIAAGEISVALFAN